MKHPRKSVLALTAIALVVAAAPAVAQHEGHTRHESHAQSQEAEDRSGDAMDHAAHRAMMERSEESKEIDGLSIPDVEVVDQDGRTVRFYSDLVEDRVVAINFVFTTCTTICPPMGAIFGQLEDRLGNRAGRDVHLVSVSVDPTTDTPERLTEWAARFGRESGWTLVTGEKSTVDSLLKSLQVFNADFSDHSPVVLLGNDATREWTRAYGLAPPETLAEILDRLSAGGDAAAADGSSEER